MREGASKSHEGFFMNVLLIGSGGREHALAWKLKQSPLINTFFCAPGNPGIAKLATCVALDVANHGDVINFCKANHILFVVVGPEDEEARDQKDRPADQHGAERALRVIRGRRDGGRGVGHGWTL